MTYLISNIQDITISPCNQIQKILSILHSSLSIESSQSDVCFAPSRHFSSDWPHFKSQELRVGP